MAPLIESVRAALTALGADLEHGRFAVAFSGGVDSAVLLHALHRLCATQRLRALHVDHGLHPDSGRWSEQCAAAAQSLGVAFAVQRLALRLEPGQSLEAQARHARYAALAGMLQPDEVLLTAHHADDQLETLLLRFLRGAGVRGLTAIAPWLPFGAGYLARPLLDVRSTEIRQQASAWRLDWIEDPSNLDLRWDRNYLRAEVLPALRRRWPRAAQLANRTAQRMREAQALLDGLATTDLAMADGALGSIPLGVLPNLTPARERNALRALIARRGLPLPSALQLEQLRAAMRIGRPDAQICVCWPGAEARIYRQRLYLQAPQMQRAVLESGRVSSDQPWTGPAGHLEFVPGAGPVSLPESWAKAGLDLRFRVGGERLRKSATRRSTTLKNWFQAAGIVPWMRDRIPLLYHAGELVAVADLWGRDMDSATAVEPLWQVRWTAHPPVT